MHDGSTQNKLHTLTHYIRDIQHHPENTHNTKYTDQELAQSIEDMRNYLETKMTIVDEWLCEDDAGINKMMD